MKNLMMAITLLFLSLVARAADVDVKETDNNAKIQQHTITLTAGSGPFVFGRPAWWKVSYRNQGKEPWVIPTPTESTSVFLFYTLVKSERRSGYRLGNYKITTIKSHDGLTMTSYDKIKPKLISIAPGKSYDFEVVLDRNWTGNIVPGRWNGWIEDEELKLRSNKSEISLTFTVDSIVVCLQKAMDETLDVTQRESYAEWLIKIMPGLDLHWWSEDTPIQERQKMEIEIRQKLQVFKAFLADKGNAKAIEGAIKNINRESGESDVSDSGLEKVRNK